MSDSPRPTEDRPTEDRPTVLFLCIHNAGRSQMALGWFRHLAAGRATAWSGGSEPAEQLNPVAVAAMAEVGIDIAAEQPRRWTDANLRSAEVVITMGCGDTCTYYPGKRYEDWALDDPAGQDLDAVRRIRDDIERRVRALLDTLAPGHPTHTLAPGHPTHTLAPGHPTHTLAPGHPTHS
ncbi:MAG: arsenate reductase ArsC [Microthrixaceae bacterium]|nr:arsenate reductase ArsC [Microthrixaceae bacterium]